MPAKAGIPLLFEPLGDSRCFFKTSFAGMTHWETGQDKISSRWYYQCLPTKMAVSSTAMMR